MVSREVEDAFTIFGFVFLTFKPLLKNDKAYEGCGAVSCRLTTVYKILICPKHDFHKLVLGMRHGLSCSRVLHF